MYALDVPEWKGESLAGLIRKAQAINAVQFSARARRSRINAAEPGLPVNVRRASCTRIRRRNARFLAEGQT